MKLFIHSETSTVVPLKLGMDKYFHPTLYNGCKYLSIPELKLNYVSKRGPRTSLGLLKWYPFILPVGCIDLTITVVNVFAARATRRHPLLH